MQSWCRMETIRGKLPATNGHFLTFSRAQTDRQTICLRKAVFSLSLLVRPSTVQPRGEARKGRGKGPGQLSCTNWAVEVAVSSSGDDVSFNVAHCLLRGAPSARLKWSSSSCRSCRTSTTDYYCRWELSQRTDRHWNCCSCSNVECFESSQVELDFGAILTLWMGNHSFFSILLSLFTAATRTTANSLSLSHFFGHTFSL